MVKPILSIIIVSYNTADITVNCIKSILLDKKLEFDLSKQKNNDSSPAEIIVIDNNSHDDSVAKLKKIKYLKIIENKDNAGFGKANNQGIKIAQGNYILFLNSDTIILHSAISQSLNWLSSHPEATTCTAQLLNKNRTIQATGGFFPNLANVITWSFSLDDLPFVNKFIKPLHPHTPNFYTKDNFYLKDHQQDWVTGAFMMVRLSALNNSGTFDENYFMYGEEVELSYRIKQTNKENQVWFLIGPQVIHLGGASAVKKIDPILNEYKGILAFFKKHKSNFEYQIVRGLLKLNALIRSIIYSSPIYREACSKI